MKSVLSTLVLFVIAAAQAAPAYAQKASGSNLTYAPVSRLMLETIT